MAPLSRRDALRGVSGTVAAAWLARSGFGAPDDMQPLRVGMIGLDTSHVSVFTKYLNRNNRNDPALDGVRMVAAYPGGNPDFPLSIGRLKAFTKEVRELGVTIVESIDELLTLVDVVMIESVDGTQHLEQARPVLAAHKPLYIDKPLAASLADALAIARLGSEHATPWFTASSSRFTPGYPELKDSEQIGEILGCDTYSQARAAPGHPDLFWYGVHGVDLLYSLMGTGCESVTAVQTPYTEQVTGTWQQGRVGTFRAIREHTGQTGLGATVFGSKGIAHVNNYYNYYPLMAAIVHFFRTRVAPVSVDEMVEVFAYMAAAEESKRRGGEPVKLSEVIEQAQQAR